MPCHLGLSAVNIARLAGDRIAGGGRGRAGRRERLLQAMAAAGLERAAGRLVEIGIAQLLDGLLVQLQLFVALLSLRVLFGCLAHCLVLPTRYLDCWLTATDSSAGIMVTTP